MNKFITEQIQTQKFLVSLQQEKILKKNNFYKKIANSFIRKTILPQLAFNIAIKKPAIFRLSSVKKEFVFLELPYKFLWVHYIKEIPFFSFKEALKENFPELTIQCEEYCEIFFQIKFTSSILEEIGQL